MSVLECVLGEFWIFVKNFFEGHTSPPPRSAFAPPVPLRNEPGCFDRFTNLLRVNLLQHWYTCLSVATSVKISVFGGYFWRSLLCIYYANEFSFLPLFLSFFDSFLYSLFRCLLCHITTLSSCHIICGCSLKCCGLKCRRRATLFALEDLKTYHVVKLFCGRRFCSCWGV